ncbi:conserved hypothetical protein [Microsporum canis CBS 113480]|uniref:Uncharacterized protein n=1 Tax=Arthroderma otae (strain ATCC MYA-4605 / CBS 113480) TaxID=554155 RepID=C5FGE0_ARTOC|nr:conserved hypothetical protein [Microsporum canis CBS 113480]EEQ29825.1 conserved hypothetical protein [Microsporum canis CBS 113480]
MMLSLAVFSTVSGIRPGKREREAKVLALVQNSNSQECSCAAGLTLSAVILLALPLQALASTCYFCENTPHVGAVKPTYDCGKKCHKKNYNTHFSNYHCWMDGRNPTCFKNCCKRGGKQFVVCVHNYLADIVIQLIENSRCPSNRELHQEAAVACSCASPTNILDIVT